MGENYATSWVGCSSSTGDRSRMGCYCGGEMILCYVGRLGLARRLTYFSFFFLITYDPSSLPL